MNEAVVSSSDAASSDATSSAVLPLRAYQSRWIDDDARFKISVKSARIGFSFATALEAVLDCLQRKTTWTVLSASKPQSVEFIQSCATLIEVMLGTVQLYEDEAFYDELGHIEAIQQRITFPNGARIIALPANPRTARAYPGNAILDEFAHHDPSVYENLYNALEAKIYRRIVGSTLTSHGSDGGKGTQALGNVHQATKEERSVEHTINLESIINRQIVRQLVWWNYGPDAPMPTISFDKSNEEDRRCRGSSTSRTRATTRRSAPPSTCRRRARSTTCGR